MSRKRLRRGIIPDGLVQSRISIFNKGGGLLMQTGINEDTNWASRVGCLKRKLDDQIEGPIDPKKKIKCCSTGT